MPKKIWRLGCISGTDYGNLHPVELSRDERLLITHAQLAGLRDLFISWFATMLYAHLNSQKYPSRDLYKEVVALLHAGAQFTRDHPEYMSSVLKTWPSFAIATILRDCEGDPTFYNNIVGDFKPVATTSFYTLLTRTVRTEADVHMLLELSGLWKSFGHPIINVGESVKAWVEKPLA